ncbi:MAG TPA: glycosyltransferase [Tepidisphaeraceae bacterium]|nr:glycosyltransferase [Tepidisphaeraceae bacterium]
MKRITVVTPCFNEEANIRPLYEAIRDVFAALPNYTYDQIYIDNCSRDRSRLILRELAAEDPRVKVIFNTRNFGHIRSPFHGLLQSDGDATILMASDFQDPPELIPQFLRKWEDGFKVVLGVKETSSESRVMFWIRSVYYRLINRLAGDVALVKNATGFGLYDQAVVRTLRTIEDPYPYTRGLVADLGYESAKIPFHQPRRQRGITKNNFYTLYDMAMLGITNHSKVPLRLATMLGFAMSAVSFLLAVGYLIAKLIWWKHFPMGVAPILIGLLFFSSIQLFFIGLLGEYIGAIFTQVQKRPLVIEQERLNFDSSTQMAEAVK